MTIILPAPPSKHADTKHARGICITQRCTHPSRTNERLCARCRDRIWRARHPEHHLWNNLKKSAKRRGILFTLPLDEFKAFCIREDFVARVGRSADSATVDRIDRSLGYVSGNLRVLSNEQNGRLGGYAVASRYYTIEEDPLRC